MQLEGVKIDQGFLNKLTALIERFMYEKNMKFEVLHMHKDYYNEVIQSEKQFVEMTICGQKLQIKLHECLEVPKIFLSQTAFYYRNRLQNSPLIGYVDGTWQYAPHDLLNIPNVGTEEYRISIGGTYIATAKPWAYDPAKAKSEGFDKALQDMRGEWERQPKEKHLDLADKIHELYKQLPACRLKDHLSEWFDLPKLKHKPTEANDKEYTWNDLDRIRKAGRVYGASEGLDKWFTEHVGLPKDHDQNTI